MSREETTDGDNNSHLDNLKPSKGLIADYGAFIIALIVIIPFILFTFTMIVSKTFTFNDFKDIAAIWGVWVGSVIGYFFGSRPVENLTRRVEEVMGSYEEVKKDYENLIDDYEQDFKEYDKDYNAVIQDLQFLVGRYGQNFDTELLKRLEHDYNIRR